MRTITACRSEPFLYDDFKGIRPYSEELVKFLKSRGHLDGYRLLEILGIGRMNLRPLRQSQSNWKSWRDLDWLRQMEHLGNGYLN